MNEQQAQVLAERIKVHLPHVQVKVRKYCDIQDWYDESFEAWMRTKHEDDGTYVCQVIVPDEPEPLKSSTKHARVFYDESDWQRYVGTYEPLIQELWKAPSDGSYFPSDAEFGYSTKHHRWLLNGQVLSEEEGIRVFEERRK